ncbi:unnamed protein product [marine sediment metagenome]|uniref:Uncharacterized protein n=1 Tax=marine sediment metagenome TaxID=412755 RepID=X1R5R3_9ZZZZ
MVKIRNPLGDVKIGKQGEVVYQRHYGQQTRRMLSPKRAIASEAQIAHRQLYRAALDWRKGLSRPNRRYLEMYCIANGVVDDYHIPLPWHRFALKCYLEHVHFVVIKKASYTFEIGSKIFEHCELETGTEGSLFSNYRNGQTYPCYEAHDLTKVQIYLRRYGVAGSRYMFTSIRNVGGDDKPTGGDLIYKQTPASEIDTAPHWQEIVFDTKLPQSVGNKYAICYGYTGTSVSYSIRIPLTKTDIYPEGDIWASLNGGSTWLASGYEASPFREYGEYQEETSIPGILHVRHPALLTVVHKRGEAIVSVHDNLSSLDEEYLTKQVGIDVEAGDTIEATTIAGIEKKYQVV